jgi:hypothetical protein
MNPTTRAFVPLSQFDGIYVRPDPDATPPVPEGVQGNIEKLHEITTPRLTVLGLLIRIGAGLLGAAALVVTYKLGKSSGRNAAHEEMAAESPVETGTPNIPIPLSSVG